MTKECKLQGYDGAYATNNNAVIPADLEKIEGLRMVGTLNGFPWWADAPPVQQFRDVMGTYDKGFDYRSTSATVMWTSLELFRRAFINHGPPTDVAVKSADVIDAFHAVKDETLDGLLPQPISYVADGYQPHVTCFWPFKLEDGTFSSVAIEGESGNDERGDLRTACYSLSS